MEQQLSKYMLVKAILVFNSLLSIAKLMILEALIFSVNPVLPTINGCLVQVSGTDNTTRYFHKTTVFGQSRENGMNVAEMNALLLKKIEELTLHLIEVKKEVEELK